MGLYHCADFHFLRTQQDQYQFTPPDHGYGASAMCMCLFNVPATASTHYAYSRRDGQAEFIWELSKLTANRD